MSYKPVVAVIGINGLLGKPVLEALTSEKFSGNYSLPVRAISRKKSDKEDSELIKYYEGFDSDSYKKALAGADVVISLTGTPSQEVLDAVIATKPKLYIPSQFGTDLSKPLFVPVLDLKVQHSKAARDAGIKVVDVYTALFAKEGSFLYEIIAHVGADVQNKKVRYVGDPHTKFNFSTFPDIANTLAVLASKEPSSIPDTIRIYSGVTDQESVIKRYEQSHGIKFETSTISLDDAIAEAKERFSKWTDFNIQDFFFFLQVFAAGGEGKGVAFVTDNEREFVNPGESIFKWGQL